MNESGTTERTKNCVTEVNDKENIAPASFDVSFEEKQPLEGVKPKRDSSIDMMKGLLTVLMVFCHVLQFFPRGNGWQWVVGYISLTTFSGFMFCSGYVFNLAYANREKPEKRMFIAFIKSIFVYYLSGIAFVTLINMDLSFDAFLNVILLRHIPEYSEFLLSFAIIYVVEIFLHKQIAGLLKDKIKSGITVAVSLLMTFIRYDQIHFTPLGALIGTFDFYCFPIVQYFCYFLLGAYLSDRKKAFDLKTFILCCLGTLVIVIHVIKNKVLPGRFPPTLIWIVGGALFVYCYYLFSKAVKPFKPLVFMGKNTLFFLAVSNVALFVSQRILNVAEIENYPLFWLTAYAICMIIASIAVVIKDYVKKAIKIVVDAIKKDGEESENG